jgi:hypothetical protein
MNYLKYIERDAENLQFYLWYKDYTTRFANLPDSEKRLSPEWTAEQAQADTAAYRAQIASKKISPETAAVMKGFEQDSENEKSEEGNPFNDSRDATIADRDTASVDTRPLSAAHTTKSAYSQRAESAFDEAGLKWQPC